MNYTSTPYTEEQRRFHSDSVRLERIQINELIYWANKFIKLRLFANQISDYVGVQYEHALQILDKNFQNLNKFDIISCIHKHTYPIYPSKNALFYLQSDWKIMYENSIDYYKYTINGHNYR